ncbi:thioredoxin domain-containing protein [Niveispirillum sp. BGYR6]|uniref:thioredoxin domain-containing protein n=1 Tax=Niveispirillum sp. BGYR6 TaxID=2971249 RepID=UPI0022B942D9|nr:thioredoxin domain-containing protein [Niveispirillum sp. BGYR6]MDG5495828.1 thioredoxin domain-containing protein [Niveispirillum sp. BGYR6]
MSTNANSTSGNRLGEETSPYLLQHKDNPVHWLAWGPEALAKAKAEGKPILLSVGYAACHWCHVMAHESFENPAIAELMNQLFINIKVDREERPDIDQIYQQALALLGQQGGWPLTMFLTPDGQPFWGGTYFPPEARWGRAGFPDVLRGVAATYLREPDKVQRNVTALRDAMLRLAQGRPGSDVGPDTLVQVAGQLVREIDPRWGGIGEAPKFPQPSIFELLWRAYRLSGKPEFSAAVTHTLSCMAQGGIYDHLGGGFARYSTDEMWLVPHFEKMLYDNAQLVELMALVWAETRDPLLATRIEETIGWVLTEMVAEGGGFAATLDADSEGEEGRFYVWSLSEIQRLLPADDLDLFCQTYGVTAEGNWEDHNILTRMGQAGLSDPATEERLARCRASLLQARAGRVRPGWDNKVLADWNGLMIAAMAKAAVLFDRADWLGAARTAFAFVSEQMTRPDGRLYHSWRDGRARHDGTLEDHANMARAATALYEATGDRRFLDQAERWVGLIQKHFHDDADGGYFVTADDAAGLIMRPRHAHDNAVPAGNGTLVGLFSRLWYLTGKDEYRQQADALITAFAGEVGRNFFPLATYLNGIDLRHNGIQLVLIGQPGEQGLQALQQASNSLSLPNLISLHFSACDEIPPGHPAAGKAMVNNLATAYVCRQQSCSLPVTGPEELRRLLGA